MKYSVNDLRTPVVMIVANNSPAGVTTTEIKNELLEVLDVERSQMRILSGRTDAKITQTIRNVFCTRDYPNVGLVGSGMLRVVNVDGVNVWKVTAKGRAYLKEQLANASKRSARRLLVPT